jgi:glutamate dehydrogenase/leucine dehydrogenase
MAWIMDTYRMNKGHAVHSLDRIMRHSFREVLAVSQGQEVPMRLAAYLVAVGRVADAVRYRGIYP